MLPPRLVMSSTTISSGRRARARWGFELMAPGNLRNGAAQVLILSLGGCSAPSGSPVKVAGGDPALARTRACSAEAEVKPAPRFENVGNPIVVAADFEFPPAREVEPCVWSGTFAASEVVYADRGASLPLVTTQFVRVRSIELPRDAGKPTKLTISWPVHMKVWALAASFPFALREPLEIVKGTYWVAPGARVQAWTGEKQGLALVSTTSSCTCWSCPSSAAGPSESTSPPWPPGVDFWRPKPTTSLRHWRCSTQS